MALLHRRTGPQALTHLLIEFSSYCTFFYVDSACLAEVFPCFRGGFRQEQIVLGYKVRIFMAKAFVCSFHIFYILRIRQQNGYICLLIGYMAHKNALMFFS